MYVRRKVFSNVEQPVEEQLYSVDMTETEYALFSAYMAGYEEAMFSSKYGYDYVLNDAKAAAGDRNLTAWLNSNEGKKWIKENGKKKVEATGMASTNQALPKKNTAEYKELKKQAKQAVEDTKNVSSAHYRPSGSGKSAKAAAETIMENPDKFKDVVRKADMKRWVGKNKKALALGAAGTAALGAGAGYYAYNK